jgi:hypothetical protein
MKRASLVLAVAAALTLTGTTALAQGSVTVTLHPRALRGDGGQWLQLTVDIACDDLGAEDFQQGLAFATQQRGRHVIAGEGGVDGTVICDGVARTHTATVSLFQGSKFRGGPATATVDFLICFIDESDNQVCEQDNDTRTVLVGGRA